MKKVKKLLVTLLVLTFVLSTVSVGFAADTTTADSSQSAEVVRAQALGILKGDEKGNLNLDQPITRAEALALIVRISGLESSAGLMAGQTKFTDVNSDAGLQWATGYINLGVGQSIVNGYPDGTFKGRNQVTFAEMAKLLLYAMNYGVTVEGAPWPAGVMGKADDLDVFDGVSASPNVPATRGAVVKMIDNSLTIKHLKQTGYGDLKSYEEGTDTFLSKLKVDEIDGRITAVDVKKDQVTVTPDEDETDITKATTYTFLDKTVDVESLLGVAVTVWVNDDDEIFFIDPSTDDVKVDVVDSDVAKDADTIDLRVADDTFDLASNVKVYINGTKSDLEDLKAGMYGSFVFDNDEIIYINVKNWNEVNAGVVKEVKDNIITYFDTDGNDNELDLEDPDDGYVITLDGKAINADDIEKNDVIYVADYDDMYHIVVVRNAVSGTVDRVKDNEVKIDGTSYDVTELTTYSLDEDDEIASFVSDDVTDLTGEKATAILDIAGDLRHITSSVDVTSNEIFGVVTKADEYNEVVKIFANGESKSYEIDGDIYKGDNDLAPKLTWSDLKKYTDTSTADYAIVEFELNKDGVIKDLFVLGGYKGTTFTPSANLTVYNADKYDIAKDGLDEDHDVIKVTVPDEFYVKSTTSIIDEIDDMDAVKWEDIEGKSVAAGDASAIIVSNDKGDAELVVFVDGFSKIAEDEELGVVLDKFVESGDWKATVKVHDGEETDYLLNSKGDVEIGQTIVFKVNSDNELSSVHKVVYEQPSDKIASAEYDVYSFVGGKVTKKDGNYITIDTNNDGTGDTTYKVDSLTLIYDVTGDDVLGDIDNATLTDVKVGKSVGLVVEGKVIDVLYITSDVPASGGSTSTDKQLKAVNEAANGGDMLTALDAIDYASFEGLSSIEKARVANNVLTNRPSAGYADINAVKAAIDAAIGDSL